MGTLTQYPQAQAFRDGGDVILPPEVIARQLWSGTALANRNATVETIAGLRRAYIDGVASYRAAAAGAFWDFAERLAIVAPTLASSYQQRERQAYTWGWEDAEHGRFGEAASSGRPTVVYRA